MTLQTLQSTQRNQPENKELLIIPDASHCDLYDGGYEEKAGKGQSKNMIPWDKVAEFFKKNLN